LAFFSFYLVDPPFLPPFSLKSYMLGLGRVWRWLRGGGQDPLSAIEELTDAVENASHRADLVLRGRHRAAVFLSMFFLLLELVLFAVQRWWPPAKPGSELAIGGTVLLEGVGAREVSFFGCFLWPVVYWFVVRRLVHAYFQYRASRADQSLDELRKDLEKAVKDFEKDNDIDRMLRVLGRGKQATRPPRQHVTTPRAAGQPSQGPKAGAPKQPHTAPVQRTAPVQGEDRTPRGNGSSRPASRVNHAIVGGGDDAAALRPSTPLSAEEARQQREKAQQPPPQEIGTPIYTQAVPRDQLQNRGVVRAQPPSPSPLAPNKNSSAAGGQAQQPGSLVSWLLDLMVGEPPMVPVVCKSCGKTHGLARGDGRHLLEFTCSHCQAFNPRRHGSTENGAGKQSAADDDDNNNSSSKTAADEVDGDDDNGAGATTEEDKDEQPRRRSPRRAAAAKKKD
jgi:Predicted integral membrane zinc-ribbon metal-binding protein